MVGKIATYRFTFHLDEETLVLRTIGTHDILLRE